MLHGSTFFEGEFYPFNYLTIKKIGLTEAL